MRSSEGFTRILISHFILWNMNKKGDNQQVRSWKRRHWFSRSADSTPHCPYRCTHCASQRTKKDNHSRRGLLGLVQKRRRLRTISRRQIQKHLKITEELDGIKATAKLKKLLPLKKSKSWKKQKLKKKETTKKKKPQPRKHQKEIIFFLKNTPERECFYILRYTRWALFR